MKHWRKITGILALALLPVLAACGKKSDPESEARKFFDLLSAGKTKECLDGAAFTFQTRQTPESFDANARELGLVGARELSLTRREGEPSETVFRGSVATAAGARLEFELKMLPERGVWRVAELRTLANGPGRARENRFSLVGKQPQISRDLGRKIPPQGHVKALAHEAISKFARGIEAKDFEVFYEYISQKWRSQVSKVRLYRAFEPFIVNNIDFSDVRDMDPVLDAPPFINPDGLLVVKGHYPTTPKQKRFDMKFIYELPKWRLFGINVQLVDVPGQPQQAPAPSAPQGGDPGFQ